MFIGAIFLIMNVQNTCPAINTFSKKKKSFVATTVARPIVKLAVRGSTPCVSYVFFSFFFFLTVFPVEIYFVNITYYIVCYILLYANFKVENAFMT